MFSVMRLHCIVRNCVWLNLMKDRGELDVRLMCYFYSQLVFILVDACIHNVLTELVMSLINGRVDGQLCILLVGMVICLL